MNRNRNMSCRLNVKKSCWQWTFWLLPQKLMLYQLFQICIHLVLTLKDLAKQHNSYYVICYYSNYFSYSYFLTEKVEEEEENRKTYQAHSGICSPTDCSYV